MRLRPRRSLPRRISSVGERVPRIEHRLPLGPRHPHPTRPMRTQGLRRIISFNWPKFVAAVAFIIPAGLIVRTKGAGSVLGGLALTGAILCTYFVIASLTVSWWVYDRSGLHRWTWLQPLLPVGTTRWALVHAGFDEGGPLLPEVLGSPATVVDLSPGLRHTSPSLRRARRRHPASSTVIADGPRLPIADESLDAVLLVFAAHEVRDRSQREALFEQLRRTLRGDGRVILVEHLRDATNIAAFGAGALHFQTRREWRRVAKLAGFAAVREIRETRFVRGIAPCL
ncbi:MAG: methyltransferase domain-containing protein [Actinobacteria bacterium]|nr:MAG: methyltransferase domain-containing protein [Actinomycetota bacterium]